MTDFFDDKISERLGGLNFGKSTIIYKFELIKRAKAAAKLAHPDIKLIDMGVGEPDWPADDIVVKALSEEAGKPENRWYADNGIPEFQQAAAGYLEKVYGVKGISPSVNIVHGIGSKPVLAMLPICFINQPHPPTQGYYSIFEYLVIFSNIRQLFNRIRCGPIG